LGGGGAFPNERRGRVLWVGVAKGAGLLTQLAVSVGALLAPLGYEPDARPFHAHLTLARLKTPGALHDTLARLDAAAFGPAWGVNEVVLFHSHTHADGATYEVVERASLAPRDRAE
jgi:2'-5' RNA ligase